MQQLGGGTGIGLVLRVQFLQNREKVVEQLFLPCQIQKVLCEGPQGPWSMGAEAEASGTEAWGNGDRGTVAQGRGSRGGGVQGYRDTLR